MGRSTEPEIEAWLRDGGLVVTASDRAARALSSAFHLARRDEGLSAWPAPNILDWKSFVRGELEQRSRDGRLLLDPIQERALWAEIAGSHDHAATLLEGPRHLLARLAMEAHELLCSYAPDLLRASARSGWQQDAAVFSEWLTAFDETCRNGQLLSPARLPLALATLLQAEPPDSRPPLLLAGFDRILPTQRNFFNAWGEWQVAATAKPAEHVPFYEALETQAELAACAIWSAHKLADNPEARLLVVTQDASDRTRRGQIERAFLQHTQSRRDGFVRSPLFEFSLGVPLSQIAIPKAACLLLRWLSGPIAEHELDWLFFAGNVAASAQETEVLQSKMRALRCRNLQQPEWTLEAFIATRSGREEGGQLPTGWVSRLTEAKNRLGQIARRTLSPLEWVELVPRLLEAAGYPGGKPLSSAEFQAADRWQQTVESCGSLGFDGRRIPWKEFLSILRRSLDETLYAAESQDAPIQIAGPAESAGLSADAIWFLGASEAAWPASGPTHPLLPPEVQRRAGMPHASAQLDWELAQAITTRLTASAPEVHFSYARQNAGAEARPSRLIALLAGAPQPMPPELAQPTIPPPRTVCFEDFGRIPFAPGKVPGGSSVLTSQSQCPFQAFATARLGAQSWELAEAGLTAAQRGQLLHAVLHSVWAGPPHGLRSLQELREIGDLSQFVAHQVEQVLDRELSSALRERMPERYLELEALRLISLVTQWLNYEATRVDFEIEGTEVKRTEVVAGLTLDLRLDRIDRLVDGSLLVIDYKSGDVKPSSWELPRPEDVQLPLYAGFAVDGDLGGLVFAKVRAGDPAFAGRVGDAKTTLLANLKSNSALMKTRLTAELLIDWRDHIELLARDFLAGRAEVDPREYPKTCEKCGLQTLCRIPENVDLAQLDTDEDAESAEADDE